MERVHFESARYLVGPLQRRLARERGDLSDSLDHLKHSAASPHTRKAAHTLLAEVRQAQRDREAAANEVRLVSDLPEDVTWPDPLIWNGTQVTPPGSGPMVLMTPFE